MGRRKFNEARQLLLQTDLESGPRREKTPRTDRVDIEVMNLETIESLQPIDLTLKQGCLVAIYGPQQCGKATLMQLIGHSTLPRSGMLFVPSHLRTLYVSEVPVF